ncbi:MAG: YoaK family protein [Vitreoscilla sp.]
MKLSLPALLSLNAGYVDTAGFLALQGLFTAHVTGNFVTLGAALVLGTSGILAKLLALPVFCVVIVATRLVAPSLPRLGLPALRTMLWLKLALLAAGAALAISIGPGHPAGEPAMVVTGMLLVSAMAIQNAISRVHLGTSPPTTLMTGTTTQMMLDIADLLRGLPDDQRAAALGRLSRMGINVGAFALGCAAGALLFSQFRMVCFVVPPLLAVVPLLMDATREP